MIPQNNAGRDALDLYLGHILKSFVAQYSPPITGRERLLLAASSIIPVDRAGNTSFLSLIAHVLQRGYKALSYILAGPSELEPLPGKMAIVFINTTSFS